MKKSLIFASIACAGAFALHADWTCQNWFKGIGASPTGSSLPASLDPVNGSWAAQPASGSVPFAGSLSLEGGKLVFDLDDGEHLDFTVGGTAAADSGTVTDVEVTGVFTPVSDSLPDNSTMNDRNAQVGFVVRIDGDATNYCAWTGSGWVALTNEAVDAGANIEAETKLLVRFDYRLSTKTASFAIVKGSATNFLGNATDVALPITATAVSAGRVQGVSCYGSGTLAQADGGVGLGVADANGVKYGSLQDAIDAATSGQVVTVWRTTTETVNTKDGVKISDPNKLAEDATISVPPNTTVGVVPTSQEINSGASGSCTVPLNFSGATEDQVVIDLGTVANYKEVVKKSVSGNTLTFDLRTKTEIITNAVPTGAKKLAADPEELHKFLAANGGTAYTKAEPSSGEIADVLSQTGANEIKLWESYVLGINPSDSIKPVPPADGDASKDKIKLGIPALVGKSVSGDYIVKYQLYKGEDAVGLPVTSASEIEIPVSSGTGTYSVKAVLSEPNP